MDWSALKYHGEEVGDTETDGEADQEPDNHANLLINDESKVEGEDGELAETLADHVAGICVVHVLQAFCDVVRWDAPHVSAESQVGSEDGWYVHAEGEKLQVVSTIVSQVPLGYSTYAREADQHIVEPGLDVVRQGPKADTNSNHENGQASKRAHYTQ